MATTEEVRDRFLVDPYDHFPRQERGGEFDRWLNQVKDEAFREGVAAARDHDRAPDWAQTGVFHPYAYREWDGEYGMKL